MKIRRVYENSFKAKVVIEHLRDHKSIEDLSKKYEIHPNQIKNWKSLLFARAGEIFRDRRRKLVETSLDVTYPNDKFRTDQKSSKIGMVVARGHLHIAPPT
jgi:transposase